MKVYELIKILQDLDLDAELEVDIHVLKDEKHNENVERIITPKQRIKRSNV